jgi:hypothetical protein
MTYVCVQHSKNACMSWWIQWKIFMSLNRENYNEHRRYLLNFYVYACWCDMGLKRTNNDEWRSGTMDIDWYANIRRSPLSFVDNYFVRAEFISIVSFPLCSSLSLCRYMLLVSRRILSSIILHNWHSIIQFDSLTADQYELKPEI